MELLSTLFGLKPQNFSLKEFYIFSKKNNTLKKFLILSQRKIFLIFPWTKPCTFRPKLKKFQKVHPKRTSFYFRKWNFLALILRNFRKLKPSRKSHIFQETKTPKKILIFCKMELSVHPEKISYTSKNRSPEKFLIFSQRKVF